RRLRPEYFGQLKSQPILGVGQLPRFGVVIALPGQLANGGEPKPHIEQSKSIRFILDLVEQIPAQVEPVHQGPGVVAFSTDNLICHRGERAQCRHTLRCASYAADRDIKVSVAVFEPGAAITAASENKLQPERDVSFWKVQVQPIKTITKRKGGLRRGLSF